MFFLLFEQIKKNCLIVNWTKVRTFVIIPKSVFKIHNCLLHFNDMVWYGILMLWYDIPMSWYEVFLKKQNDMKWYAFVWYGMLHVCYWIWGDFPPWTVELFCFAFFKCNVQIDFLYKNTHPLNLCVLLDGILESFE